MQWFKLRPTFEILLSDSYLTASKKLQAAVSLLATSDPLLHFHGEYGEIHLPPELHRVWSPHLSFCVYEPRDDNAASRNCVLHGRFAPRWQVWTFVWAVYLAMSFSIFFGLALAYSQWMVQETMSGLIVVVFGIFVIASLYVIAHLGQQRSVDQMHLLRDRLEKLMEAANLNRI